MVESAKIANARTNIERALDGILLDWSKEMRATCVVRSPTNPESYMIVTSDDDLDAVAALLKSPPTQGGA